MKRRDEHRQKRTRKKAKRVEKLNVENSSAVRGDNRKRGTSLKKKKTRKKKSFPIKKAKAGKTEKQATGLMGE